MPLRRAGGQRARHWPDERILPSRGPILADCGSCRRSTDDRTSASHHGALRPRAASIAPAAEVGADRHAPNGARRLRTMIVRRSGLLDELRLGHRVRVGSDSEPWIGAAYTLTAMPLGSGSPRAAYPGDHGVCGENEAQGGGRLLPDARDGSLLDEDVPVRIWSVVVP